MPEPGENENEQEFMARCIPMVQADGTAESNDQAVAICMSKWSAKTEGAGDTNVDTKPLKFSCAVKAVGDWELDVLAIPYGGPNRGKDSDKQFFNQSTDLMENIYQKAAIFYYHGYDENGRPQGEPELIGEELSRTHKADGVWVRVVLDKASKYAKRVWEAAQKGLARASSGSIEHIRRIARDGFIKLWPFVELSLFDTDGKRQPANNYAVALPAAKAHYMNNGILFPEIVSEQDNQAAVTAVESGKSIIETVEDHKEMEAKDISALIDAAIAADREAQAKGAEAAAKAKADEDARIAVAVKARTDQLEKELAESRRLPIGGAPTILKFNDMQYNNLDAGDQAFMLGILREAHKPVSETAIKSLAAKLEEDKTGVGEMGRQALKARGIKANELSYSTYDAYGDEWVGVAYSQALWESIRVGTFVANRIPSVEVPPGMESIVLPLESTDPVFYKVAEATTYSAPNVARTVTNSPLGSALVTLSLAKMGGSVIWSGELDESSLIPFASQLRQQMQKSGAEYLESAIIDGDTVTTSSGNINNSGGAVTTGGHYLLFNGFRKSPITTTTANLRSGGVLGVDDFLSTVKLMGGAGINALERSKVSFIVDPNTHWKALTLSEILTRDVFSQPTVEGGLLTSLFGYGVDVSGQMHKSSATRLVDSNGEVNATDTTQNLYGAILAVRWDQWKLGWRRRMTIETTRIPHADVTEIVALMRVGLIQRDTEASAISVALIV